MGGGEGADWATRADILGRFEGEVARFGGFSRRLGDSEVGSGWGRIPVSSSELIRDIDSMAAMTCRWNERNQGCSREDLGYVVQVEVYSST